jgi:hypothetical protein
MSLAQNPAISDLVITKSPTTICARILLILNAALIWCTTLGLVGQTQRLSLVWFAFGLWPLTGWIALSRLRTQANAKTTAPVRKVISVRLLCMLDGGLLVAAVCVQISPSSVQ